MEFARFQSLMASALVIPFLVACGEPPDPDLDLGEPAAEDIAPGQETPAGPPAHVMIPLNPVDDSGVSGDAMLMQDQGAMLVTVDVTGLPAEGEYPTHIHEGTCLEGGPVAEPLSHVAGMEDGSGSSTTTLALDVLDWNQALFVQVHGEAGEPIACGDIVE